MTKPPKPPTTGQLVAIIAAALLAGSMLGGLNPYETDFAIFYDAAANPHSSTEEQLALRRPNLNPPTFTLLIRPLTLLPKTVAFLVWSSIGMLALVSSIVLIHRRLRLSAYELTWIAIACIGFMPFALVWAEGQVTWMLLYLLTRAWLAPTPSRAGLWFGLAIAIKPHLALMAICLQLHLWLTATAVSASVTVAALAFTGLAPWITWWTVIGDVHWIGYPYSVSVWSIPARLQAGGVEGLRFRDLSPWTFVVGGIVVVALFVSTLRADRSRRWPLALMWSLAASPAGWMYYLPLVLGPAVAAWPRRSMVWRAALALWAIPLPILAAIALVANEVVVASVYSAGAVLAWIVWLQPHAQLKAKKLGD